MAKKGNAAEFRKRMYLVGGGVVSAVEREVRRAAIAADQEAVLRTPVDTGRARSNWIVSVGKTVDEESSWPVESDANRTEADKSRDGAAAMQKAVSQGLEAVGPFRAGLGEAGSIFMTNNVEYIIPLEDGHSAQAPEGMATFAVAVAAAVIRAAEIIKG